ncbi:F-box protein At3g26010-like [Fagus crenata]
MEAVFSNDDLAMEILSRLSVSELSRFKCISKRWKNLISNPSYLHQQMSRLRGISMLFIQQYHEEQGNFDGPWTFFDCAPLQDECRILKILRSVPRKIVVLTVVSIQRKKYDQNSYSFVIYSSETGKWKTSLEVCLCKDNLHENKHIHIRGRFYWLTKNQRIISFDVEQELSRVIKSLGPMRSNGGLTSACLGDTDRYLHYACADDSDLRVWMVKDHRKLDWVFKHQLNLNQFRMKRPSPVTDYFRHRAYGPVMCKKLANGVLRVIQNSIDALISVSVTVLLYSTTSKVIAILALKHAFGDASFFVASNANTYRVRRKRKEPIRSPLV